MNIINIVHVNPFPLKSPLQNEYGEYFADFTNYNSFFCTSLFVATGIYIFNCPFTRYLFFSINHLSKPEKLNSFYN